MEKTPQIAQQIGQQPKGSSSKRSPAQPDNQSLYQNLEQVASEFAERPCLEFLGRSYSYQAIYDEVQQLAAGLQQQGVAKGDRVILFLPNCPYYVISYYALLKIGAIVVNSNPLYAPGELEHQIQDCGAKILITLDLKILCDKVMKQLPHTGLEKVLICRLARAMSTVKGALFSLFQFHKTLHPRGAEFLEYAELIANSGEVTPVKVNRDDIAVLQYTGGTTGNPKGAILTHGNLIANTAQVMAWFADARIGEERILGVLPMFHVFAMTSILNMGIALGAEIVLLPRFQLEQMLKCIDRQRPTLMMGVPSIYSAVNHSPLVKRYDLSSVKYCISGGAPLPMDTKQQFESLTGCRLVEGYGLTEASPVCACNPMDGVNKEGSIGLALPETRIEVREIESPHQLLNVGEKGEICIVGPQVTQGYWHNERATANAIKEGRLHTGDVGYMDEQGYIFLLDRLKDIIICNGYSIYPRVIEEAINRHGAVAEVTVIGVAEAEHGEIPKAFIKCVEGMEVSEAELLEFLKEHLSPMEMPRAIEFRQVLPKTMIGKLSKKELREEHQHKSTGG
ncbi:long-chain-fatty-acid--CoA ligase [Dongshaea marina]|uniref:long-chain-fatty-acid--CoA ligase n=1 Tax=Dongshaea marina TaxID=2047966 RepID=UPI000D3E3AF6|nr:long-chain fatty acid--CoA ligase [Dongshaea marina]